jgi:hypothetical protein
MIIMTPMDDVRHVGLVLARVEGARREHLAPSEGVVVSQLLLLRIQLLVVETATCA